MDNIDRTPPQNNEAEQAIIGAIFIEPNALITAAEVLQPEDFYRQAHQHIFRAMVMMNEQGKALDVVTVSETLTSQGLIEDIGGISYLTDLAVSVPTAANVGYYIEIVEEKALLRRLINTATQMLQVVLLMKRPSRRLWMMPNVVF